MMPLIRSPEISTTWSDHASRPPFRGPACTGRTPAAVRHRRDQPRALAADAGAEAPLHDVLVGLQPHLVRRHRPRRVLVEERGQRVHVVALERVDVAGEQRLLLVVDRVDRVAVAELLRRSVARARWRALLTDGTLVSSSSATSSACQRRTSRRISTARCRGGRCWSAATNASRIDSRATATSAGSPPAGTTAASGIGSTQSSSDADRAGPGPRTTPGPCRSGARGASGR